MSTTILHRPGALDGTTECSSDRALLQHIALFHSLEPEALDSIATRVTRRTYGKGAHVTVADGEGAALYLVATGALRVYRLSPQGQEITLAVLGAGRVYGLSFLSPSGPSPTANVLQAAHEDTLLFHVLERVFTEIMHAHPCIAVHALHALGETLGGVSNRVEDLGLYNVKTRLARALQQHVWADASCIHATQTDLAAEIGARREEVSRALTELRKRGIIRESRRGLIVIADAPGLAHEANIGS